eukprot:4202303-Amphidinium_carterae.1
MWHECSQHKQLECFQLIVNPWPLGDLLGVIKEAEELLSQLFAAKKTYGAVVLSCKACLVGLRTSSCAGHHGEVGRRQDLLLSNATPFAVGHRVMLTQSVCYLDLLGQKVRKDAAPTKLASYDA